MNAPITCSTSLLANRRRFTAAVDSMFIAASLLAATPGRDLRSKHKSFDPCAVTSLMSPPNGSKTGICQLPETPLRITTPMGFRPGPIHWTLGAAFAVIALQFWMLVTLSSWLVGNDYAFDVFPKDHPALDFPVQLLWIVGKFGGAYILIACLAVVFWLLGCHGRR